MWTGRAFSQGLLAAALMLAPGVARPFAQQAPPAPLPTGAISGVVTDGATSRPVEGAIVSLGRIESIGSDDALPRVLTDSHGRFVFRNLATHDDYYLSARRFGYAPTRYGLTAPSGSSRINDIRRVPVVDGQWVNTIAIPLWRLGSVSGRILDERNEPVVGVAVRVFSRHRLAGNSYWIGGTIATTDDRGAYRIADLDPGQYVVGVLSVQSTVLATTPETAPHLAVGEIEMGAITGGSRSAQVSGPTIDVDGVHRLAVTNFATPPPPDARAARAYSPAFYPDASTVTTAVPIDVDYGDDKNGLDIRMRPTPAVRVSGKLEGGLGVTPPSYLLRLMPAGSESLGFGSEVATTIVERDGAFTFLNVPAGEYTLLAQPSVMDFTTGASFRRLPDAPGYPSDVVGVGMLRSTPGLGSLDRSGVPQPYWARVPLTVGGDDITNFVVPLRRSSTIRGRYVYPADRKPPPADLHVPFGVYPASGDPSIGRATGTLSGDEFVVEGLLTGTYVLSAGYGTVSVMVNGQDVRDTGIDVSSGADVNDVVITVTGTPAHVAGSVRATGANAQGAVIAFPADRTRWTNYGWETGRFATATTDASGGFSIDALREGEYLLIAVDPRLRDAWSDPAFLEAAAPLATPLSVKWGDKKNVNLTLATVTVK